MIDKKYSLNQLCWAEHISGIIDTVEKAFWVEYDMVLKVTHHIKED
jgi:hypothetical protein